MGFWSKFKKVAGFAANPVLGQARMALGLGGDSKTVQGITLPSGMELDYLDSFDKTLVQYDNNIQKLNQQRDLFDRKIASLEKLSNASIPSEKDLKELTNINMELGKSFGLSAQELVNSGYLTSDEAASLDEMRKLEDVTTRIEDAQLENQISNQRSQLEQDLAMRGVSASIRAQQLSAFDNQAEMMRAGRSDELRGVQTSLISNRLGTASNLRQSNLGMASQGFQNSLTMSENARAGIAQSQGLAQAGAEGSALFAEASKGQLEGQQATYSHAGSFNFSKYTNKVADQRYGTAKAVYKDNKAAAEAKK